MISEMLQYIHEGHQGKERCLLWAKNTVFWPKMTHDVQEHNKSGLINYGDKIITVMYQYTHKELYILSEPSEGKENYPPTSKEICKRTQTGETNIGSTQTKYNLGTSNSCKPMYHKLLLDHVEKAEFHTPAIPNTVRDCVQNSLENVSPHPTQMTLPTSDTYPQASASFDSKSEDREEIADTSAPALEIARISKVNKKELWEASQFI